MLSKCVECSVWMSSEESKCVYRTGSEYGMLAKGPKWFADVRRTDRYRWLPERIGRVEAGPLAGG